MTGCCVFGCKNRSEQGYILKCFPKNLTRRNKWLKNLNRNNWTPTLGSRICEVHFDLDQWEKPRADGKRKLKGSAIPTLFVQGQEVFNNQSRGQEVFNNQSRGQEVFNNQSRGQEVFNNQSRGQEQISSEKYVKTEVDMSMCSQQQDVAVQTDDVLLKETIRVLRRKSQVLKRLLQKEKLQNKSLEPNIKCVESVFNSDEMEALHNKNLTNETITEALNIEFTNGTNGDETDWCVSQFPLPSVQAFESRIQNLRFNSGILHEVFEFLKIKLSKTMHSEKDCALTLGEMALKSSIDYCKSSNTHVGPVTLPGHEGLASRALVFMLAGINSGWKEVVAYYFTGDTVDGNQIGKIVLEIIKCATSIGLTVHSVTSDFGASNQQMWNSLGIVVGKSSKIVNFIKNPCNQSSLIYFMADVPHLYRIIKQCLITNKIIEIPNTIMVKYDLPSKFVNVEHVKNFCDEQDNTELKFAQGSLNLNHDVSCGLKFMAEERNNSSIITTAWFVDFIFKWYKVLTSRNSTQALSKFDNKKYQETLNFLADIIELFTHMKIAPNLNGLSTWKPMQTGVLLSTASIINLQDVFLNRKKYTCLLTSRFTQDCLENVYSLLRSKQPLPSPLQFKQELKDLFVSQYLKINNSNSSYEDDHKPLHSFLDYTPNGSSTTLSSTFKVDL